MAFRVGNIWTPFSITGATKGNPEGVEDTVFSEVADTSVPGLNRWTISGGIDGGVAVPNDPGDGVWFVRPLLDTFGQPVVGTSLYSAKIAYREIAPPGLASDTAIFVGIINETDPDSATVDGFGVVFRYAAGTRYAGGTAIANGAPTFAFPAAPTGSARRGFGAHANWTASGHVGGTYVWGANDAGSYTVNDFASLAGPVMAGTLYAAVAVFRTAATAGAEQVAFQAAHYVGPPPASGTAP